MGKLFSRCQLQMWRMDDIVHPSIHLLLLIQDFVAAAACYEGHSRRPLGTPRPDTICNPSSESSDHPVAWVQFGCAWNTSNGQHSRSILIRRQTTSMGTFRCQGAEALLRTTLGYLSPLASISKAQPSQPYFGCLCGCLCFWPCHFGH